MEQFDSSVEESSKVSEQQQRNDEQKCSSCAAELTEAFVWKDLERIVGQEYAGLTISWHGLVCCGTDCPVPHEIEGIG